MSNQMIPDPNRGFVPEFTLGDRLRKAREHSHMEMQELADAIDIHRQTVARYENGLAVPKRHVMMSWAMSTGVAVGWLESGKISSHVEESSRPTDLGDSSDLAFLIGGIAPKPVLI